MKRLLIASIAAWLSIGTVLAAHAERSDSCTCKQGVGICIQVGELCLCLCSNQISLDRLIEQFVQAGLTRAEAKAAANHMALAMNSCQSGNCTGRFQIQTGGSVHHVKYQRFALEQGPKKGSLALRDP